VGVRVEDLGIGGGLGVGVDLGAARLDAEPRVALQGEREIFIDNLLVRIHFIIETIWWTGLVSWEFESPFPGSLISTFLGTPARCEGVAFRVWGLGSRE